MQFWDKYYDFKNNLVLLISAKATNGFQTCEFFRLEIISSTLFCAHKHKWYHFRVNAEWPGVSIFLSIVDLLSKEIPTPRLDPRRQWQLFEETLLQKKHHILNHWYRRKWQNLSKLYFYCFDFGYIYWKLMNEIKEIICKSKYTRINLTF